MRDALAAHDALVRAAIDAHGGYVFATGGVGRLDEESGRERPIRPERTK